jgi:shikimate kinase
MVDPVSAPLRLALIGMSGAGKTFWSKRLGEQGYPALSCDDEIEKHLRSRLHSGGYTGINGVAAWMGWPDSPSYAAHEGEYLAAEIAVLDQVLGELEKNPARALILDTTGSVIYTGTNLLLRLRRQMTVVHLAASEKEQALLVERYLNDPKPVLWRGAFLPKKNEPPLETVKRCYPTLIASRRQSYETLAHRTIPVAELRQNSLTAEDFLSKVRAGAEKAR